MPTVEERVSSLEGKLDAIADLRNAVGELRTDMHRQFDEFRTDMDRRFEQADRRLAILDQRVERHFMWMVGIQFTVLLTVIVALIRLSPR